DKRVHVLVVAGYPGRVARGLRQHVGKRGVDGLALVRAEHAGALQRLRPRAAALDVDLEQPPVEGKRRTELEHRLVRRTSESTGPESHRHRQCRTRTWTARSGTRFARGDGPK